jgi:hypothetical protein
LEGLGQLKNPVTSPEVNDISAICFFSDFGKEKQFLELPVYYLYTRE